MAASAGLRHCRPVVRFHDEFGGLGSAPTPRLAEQKVYHTLFVQKPFNAVISDIFNENKLPQQIDVHQDINGTRMTLSEFREYVNDHFDVFVDNFRHLDGVDHGSLHVLFYYSPYFLKVNSLADIPLPKKGIEEVPLEMYPIHTQRLFERIEQIKVRVKSEHIRIPVYDFWKHYNHIHNVVEGHILNDTKLCRCCEPGTLELLTIGVSFQLALQLN